MPKKLSNALTAAKVRTLTTPGTYADGAGLTLRVEKSGSKRWVQRMTVGGKQRNIGLGGYPAVGLKEARDAALDNLTAIRQGLDPIAEKKAAREYAQRPSTPTFAQAAEQVIEMRRPTWSSDRHAKQWSESLHNHVYPLIGRKPVDEVTSADVLAVMTPIWNELPETATRVKQRMGVVFDWAIAAGLRIDNPASAVARALPRRPRLKEHHRALPYADVPSAVAAIRQSTAHDTTRLALEFVILCASRANEVRGMEWAEICGDVWTVPPSRMKGRQEHRVPLSGRCMEILAEAREFGNGDGLVFPGGKGKLSNMAFTELLRRLDIPAVTHGFRASFRSWCMEQPGVSWAACERALAHKLGGSEVEAYARGDLLKERRALMAAWAMFCVGEEQNG